MAENGKEPRTQLPSGHLGAEENLIPGITCRSVAASIFSMLVMGMYIQFAEVILSDGSALAEKALPIPDYRIKLVLRKHDMSSDEGKTEALRESAGVLAEVDSPVERERLIRLLARYHPNFSTGTTLAEDHLRGEVKKAKSRAGRSGPRREAVLGTEQESTGETKKRTSLVENSERLLLGIIIVRSGDAGKVFDVLPPKEFTGQDTRALAEAVRRQWSELGKIDQEKLRAETRETAGEGLLMDLLLGLDEWDLNYESDQLVSVILTHKKNERRRKMRMLSEKISEGAIGRGDEEYQEYYRLVRETHSRWRR